MIRPVEQAKLMLDHRTSTIEKALAEGEGWRFMIKREDGVVIQMTISPSSEPPW
jgi:hypothetical protein